MFVSEESFNNKDQLKKKEKSHFFLFIYFVQFQCRLIGIYLLVLVPYLANFWKPVLEVLFCWL